MAENLRRISVIKGYPEETIVGELVGEVYPNLWAEMKKRAKAESPSSGAIYDSFYGGY